MTLALQFQNAHIQMYQNGDVNFVPAKDEAKTDPITGEVETIPFIPIFEKIYNSAKQENDLKYQLLAALSLVDFYLQPENDVPSSTKYWMIAHNIIHDPSIKDCENFETRTDLNLTAAEAVFCRRIIGQYHIQADNPYLALDYLMKAEQSVSKASSFEAFYLNLAIAECYEDLDAPTDAEVHLQEAAARYQVAFERKPDFKTRCHYFENGKIKTIEIPKEFNPYALHRTHSRDSSSTDVDTTNTNQEPEEDCLEVTYPNQQFSAAQNPPTLNAPSAPQMTSLLRQLCRVK